MQRLHLDILMPVLMNKRDGMRLGMRTLTMIGVEVIGSSPVSVLRVVAVNGLVSDIYCRKCSSHSFVCVIADMPMSVRTRHPGRQQGDTGQEGNSRGCLAKTLQHVRSLAAPRLLQGDGH